MIIATAAHDHYSHLLLPDTCPVAPWYDKHNMLLNLLHPGSGGRAQSESSPINRMSNNRHRQRI